MLKKILDKGKDQADKKGNIKFLLNQKLVLKPRDLLEIFEGHGIARKKLATELELFQKGERSTEAYRLNGISWWDYCGPILVNSYPTYLEQLPDLIKRINKEKRNSKNYVLFLGRNDVESNQHPCLSLIQFQIQSGKLIVSAYQRSSDASLGLPADLYHLYLISKQIEVPLGSITLFLGNVHIYNNNLETTEKLLTGENVRFNLNVG
jgi:thymidylate synthase